MYNIAISEIAKELGFAYKGPKDILVERVVYDSRNIEKGDLFVAIRGARVDGHQFIEKAIAAGAVAVVVDAAHALEREDIGCIVAPDGEAFIQALGKWCRARFDGPVVAITGSQGKTSTKDLLAQVCAVSHAIVVTKENQNNELGMPMTLTRLNEETQILIVEMGMQGFGEIEFLCEIAPPTHAIITGIGMVHAEFLGSQEGIARAKTELFKYLPENGAVALRAKDRALVAPFLDECKAKVLWCGDETEEAEVQSKNTVLGQNQVAFDFDNTFKTFHIDLPFAGRHYVDNALLVTAIACALDISKEDIQNGLGHAVPQSSNRMDMHEMDGGKLLINDCYNANPDSMMATIDVLAGYKPRPTIACLGNMYELGQYEHEGHAKVGQHLANKQIDWLICLGTLAETIGVSAIKEGMNPERVFFVDTTKQVAILLREYAKDEAVILVKGSNSMRMTEIYKYLSQEN